MRRNMRVYTFEVVVGQELGDEGYAVHSPTLAGSPSSGTTFEEAKRYIREALERLLEALPASPHPPE